MKKNYKLEIPEYLSIDRYQKLQSMEHLSDLMKLVKTINVFTDIEEDEIKTWAISDLGKVASDFSNNLNMNSQFFPMLQLDGINYGYADISTMTLAEFIDLETLCKKPQVNLHDIMAVLYRPVVKHRFNTLRFKAQHNVQLIQNKVDNVFKWFTLEKYDSETRYVNANIMKELPVTFALGALSFFLGTANLHWINSLTSLEVETKEVEKALTKQTQEALTSIGDGLRRYIHSPKQIYSVSQEKEVLLT